MESFDYLSDLNLNHNQNPIHNRQLQNLEPISAAVLPFINSSSQMLLVLLFNSLSDRSSKLVIISANTGTVIESIDIAGVGLELKVNQRVVAVATKSPLALHLYAWDTKTTTPPKRLSLVKLPCSPILDLAPKPKTGNPVFNLGSTRLLVYASSKPPNEREPPIATGTGFSFAFSPQDSRSPPTADILGREGKDCGFGSYSATRHSSHTGVSGSSWKNSVAPPLDVIDETARKLGGGLMTGAKYLSSWGQNLWNPHIDPHSSHQGRHQLPRNDLEVAFSQSAPVSHRVSAARPTPSARPEESCLTYGNVKVIDLFSSDTSTENPSHGHRHILHFKTSTDALTFLSFNPSSNLLLTSSIEGHSFHVFELRPSFRIGKSYLNSAPPQTPHSSRQATVWHRYKLNRGITSAEVADVVWRWDSKIVSVLTEHGTHHLFAIHPAGGPHTADMGEVGKAPRGPIDPLSAIFGPRVLNPRTPPPLSVNVSAFEKIKHKSLHHPSFPQNVENAGHMASLGYLDHHINEHENLGHLPHLDRTCLVFPQPMWNPSSNSSQNHAEEILSESHKRSPSVLLHDPSTNSVILYNFENKKKLLDSVTGGVSITPHSSSVGTISENQQLAVSDVKKKATTPSGLSQLMQQTKGMELRLNGPHTGNLVIGSFAPAVWHLSSIEHFTINAVNRFYKPPGHTSPSQSFIKPPSESKLGYMVHRTSHGKIWTSFAELDTFSHSLRILPRSIYICHQFDFYNFAQPAQPSPPSVSHHVYQSHEQPAYIDQLSRVDFDRIKKHKLVVKREVQIQPGDLSTHPESRDLFGLSTVEIDDHFVNHHPHPPGSHESTDSSSRYSHMYAEPLRSAVETVLDSTLASPNSSSQFLPEFPNGHPGRKGSSSGVHNSPLASFRKSVTDNVVPVVGVVNERVRKELEKITSSSVIGEVNRRRISAGLGYYNGISRSLGHRAAAEQKAEVFAAGAFSEGAATSLSFEDDQDEAIRIDRSLFDHQGPSSSSMTSFTTTNSLAQAQSDEASPAASAARSSRGLLPDSEEEDDSPERWDGWTFEDDFDFKSQEQHSTAQPVLQEECPDPDPVRTAIPSGKPVCATPDPVHPVQETLLIGDAPSKEPSSDDGGLLPPPSGQAHSERTSGSRSSSALSTSTSASASGIDDEARPTVLLQAAAKEQAPSSGETTTRVAPPEHAKNSGPRTGRTGKGSSSKTPLGSSGRSHKTKNRA